MHLSSKRETHRWDFPSGAALTYRHCESLDENLAQQLAVKWYKELLTGQALQADFCLIDSSLADFLEEIGESIDDTLSYADYLFNVALMERLVDTAEGWTLEGEPCPKSRKLFSQILRDPDIKSEWVNRAYGPLHKVKQAGNA